MYTAKLEFPDYLLAYSFYMRYLKSYKMVTYLDEDCTYIVGLLHSEFFFFIFSSKEYS